MTEVSFACLLLFFQAVRLPFDLPSLSERAVYFSSFFTSSISPFFFFSLALLQP